MNRQLARTSVHALVTFVVTLGGMLAATNQPVTTQLVVSLLPAAAVATLRALEARAASTHTGA